MVEVEMVEEALELGVLTLKRLESGTQPVLVDVM
jgi:hypothetical protein